ncbi:MAG: VOC family protein [Alphaproteobacteria bacterium]|nr:VOC family protein [Alphaproteobacteria bacterium]
MLDHLEIQTRVLTQTVEFYRTILAPLGYQQKVDRPAIGFGDETRLDMFIREGEPSSNVHYAFEAGTRQLVDEVYECARVAGLTLDRPPALAPHVHPNYYAGYMRDPDGRLVEIVCHQAE